MKWILLVYLSTGWGTNHTEQILTQEFNSERSCGIAQSFYERIAKDNKSRTITVCIQDEPERKAR